MLRFNDSPPDFTLPSHKGSQLSFSDFVGESRLMLLFIPDTEMDHAQEYLDWCAERDREMRDLDIVLLMIVRDAGPLYAPIDSPQIHLLTDASGLFARQYDAAGSEVTTYLIDKRGDIKVAAHEYFAIDEAAALIDAPTRQTMELTMIG
jgi:peroxiredoxin